MHTTPDADASRLGLARLGPERRRGEGYHCGVLLEERRADVEGRHEHVRVESADGEEPTYRVLIFR